MPRYAATLLVLVGLVGLSATPLLAQAPQPVGPANGMQAQAAPIERAPRRTLGGVTTQQPAQGVLVRVGAGAALTTVSKADDHVELRVERGVVNVSVHHPAEGSLILVDLPGGQTDLVKDGFYTFNAQTNTVHVLVGEARTFPGAASGDSKAKGIKVKEYQQFAFAGGARSTDMNAMQARTDVLPFPRPQGGEAPYYRGEPYYGGGFYPAYYGYGYPYGWGYPYGYGWGGPFVGVGFGYGFGGYGYRGGYYGGFRGRR